MYVNVPWNSKAFTQAITDTWILHLKLFDTEQLKTKSASAYGDICLQSILKMMSFSNVKLESKDKEEGKIWGQTRSPNKQTNLKSFWILKKKINRYKEFIFY